MSVSEEMARRLEELVAELGDPEAYTFLIPDWDPVDARQGLRWMQVSLGEGFYVAHHTDRARKRVFFKIWEYGEEEPGWDEPVYPYDVDDE